MSKSKRKRYRTEADLIGIHLEHYLVAKSLDGPFSTAEFNTRYRKMYPSRNEGSFLVSDHAYNNDQIAKDQFPSFLEMLGRAKYQFVGLRIGEQRKAGADYWARDEIMLALEFYLLHRDIVPDKNSAEIAQLAAEIGNLAIALGFSSDEEFRNANDVHMKIMNIRSHDPKFSQGEVGKTSANILEQEVWDRFSDDLLGLRMATGNIRDALQQDETDISFAEYDEPEIAEAVEGRIVTRLHRTRERSRSIVEKKKKSCLKIHNRLNCEACGFDFSEFYGPRGDGYIECHHIKPVHEMKAKDKTKLSDLALVCANCHRMIHAKRPWLTIKQLRQILRD